MEKTNYFYIFCRFLLFLLFRGLFFFRAYNRGHVPKKGGCIIASNHLSYFDPIVLSIASPRILTFMSKKELFRNPFFSRLITALNAFPLERGTADLRALRLAIDKLKRGQTLIVFPEGTRSITGEIKDAQPGVGLLAAKAGVPVVPAYILGTDKALPANSKKVGFFKPIRVYFAPPLEFKGENSKEGYQSFSDKVIESIRDLKNSL